jgi:hypothetical protein
MTRLVVSLGSTKLTTAGDEEGVKLLRLIDPSAIEHGGLSAAFRAKANRYDVGSFLEAFVADARLIEVARKQLDREKRVADAVVAAAVAAAETAGEPASLEEAIVAAERERSAVAEALVAKQTDKAEARDARGAARAAAAGAVAPAATALPAGARRAAPPPRLAPPSPVVPMRYLAPVLRALTEGLWDCYLGRDDDSLTLAAFVDQFIASPLSVALKQLVVERERHDEPLVWLGAELLRRAGDSTELAALARFLADAAPDAAISSDCPLCVHHYTVAANIRRYLAAHVAKHLSPPLAALVDRLDTAYWTADDVLRCLGLFPDQVYQRADDVAVFRPTLEPGEVQELFDDAEECEAEGLLEATVKAAAAGIVLQLALDADPEPVSVDRSNVQDVRYAMLAAALDSTEAARAPAQRERHLGSISNEEPPSPAPPIEAPAPLQPPPPPPRS